tara:strand:+ start:3471 stop:3761 length:291 start_codon:yes stop_codon:yes gene_type:complete
MTRNRNIPFEERKLGMGSNKHYRNIIKIKEYIIDNGGQANTHEIFDHINSNGRHGITRGALSNVLGKGPFISDDNVKSANAMGTNKYYVKVWEIRE